MLGPTGGPGPGPYGSYANDYFDLYSHFSVYGRFTLYSALTALMITSCVYLCEIIHGRIE